jgi:N-methylhydantoinase B
MRRRGLDAIALAVLQHRLAAIAEEMGVLLARTGFSPNIKERHDFSCAVFDAAGRLVAQAAHIPVHLGSTPLSVRAALAACRPNPGDVVMLNDPYSGGTHLPDVTLVQPVHTRQGALLGFVANRAHHADIGGMTPGSMPLAREVYQEGLRIPPVRLVRGGRVDADVLTLFLANTRVAAEREGDLDAQRAALAIGARRLTALAVEIGRPRLAAAMREVQGYAARMMAATLRELPSGCYRAVDVLDDDGVGAAPIPIRVAITIGRGRATVDFAGTAAQVEGSVNANYAITLSAVFYVFATLARDPIPVNEGLLRCLDLRVPAGSVVNARFPAAVAGGNVETSQRIVDVVLRALAHAAPDRIPAASAGSMSNVAIGGYDRRRGRAFSYYETIAGGAGAGPHGPGASGVHTHMTNTFNTPVEALEAYYPLRVETYAIRRRSGGAGRHRGGDGLVREVRVLDAAEVTVLTDRRRFPPYGLAGASAGRTGRNWLGRGRRRRRLPGKANLRLAAGESIRIETPGGGGWGAPGRSRPRTGGAARRRPDRRLHGRGDEPGRPRRSTKMR